MHNQKRKRQDNREIYFKLPEQCLLKIAQRIDNVQTRWGLLIAQYTLMKNYEDFFDKKIEIFFFTGPPKIMGSRRPYVLVPETPDSPFGRQDLLDLRWALGAGLVTIIINSNLARARLSAAPLLNMDRKGGTARRRALKCGKNRFNKPDYEAGFTLET
uniref:Transposase n=1 Tax=Romanomermis culicivorax TaxID=13658 RepID=A0A915IEE5_ROMCU